MFEPDERQNFVDLLRPPMGYRLESAVGTTYSLDFTALTAVLLALVDAEAELDESSIKSIDSLHAVTRLADRVSVFVNRGQISSPSKVSRVTVLYDRIVREVCLPAGCFHPKVWVTHYRPRKTPGALERSDVVRVICASKNLTTSSHWEAFVFCEGAVVPGRKVNHPLNRGVGDFITRLAGMHSSPSRRILRLREAVAQTAFTFPKPLQKETAFLWQWHRGQNLHRHLPPNGRRALVVSPFVRKSFLQDILERFEKIIVVSRQRELDAIDDEDFMLQLCGPKNRIYVVQPVETDEGPAMDLHAKIFVLEGADSSITLLGSANASPSAWKEPNCEAIIQFAPGVSIDHFSDRFIFGEKNGRTDGNRPLRGWITEYKRQTLVEGEEEKAERLLEDICDVIARSELNGTYDQEKRVLSVLGRVSTELRSAFGGWTTICEIDLALLSQLHSNAVFKRFSDLIDSELCFGDVGIADLTEFLVLRVRHRNLGLERRIILKVNADFSQWREQRDAELLRQLLTRDSLKAFLEAILFEEALRTPKDPPNGQGTKKSTLPFSTLLADLPIEDVLRSCTEDSSRIEEINRVLKAFEKTEWIDEEFRQFWLTFVSAEADARKIVDHD